MPVAELIHTCKTMREEGLLLKVFVPVSAHSSQRHGTPEAKCHRRQIKSAETCSLVSICGSKTHHHTPFPLPKGGEEEVGQHFFEKVTLKSNSQPLRRIRTRQPSNSIKCILACSCITMILIHTHIYSGTGGSRRCCQSPPRPRVSREQELRLPGLQ